MIKRSQLIKSRILAALTVVLAMAALSSVALAQQDQGMGMGQGMGTGAGVCPYGQNMGQGMMMGPGMMGQGNMMGSGMMGQGQMGQGMRPGMMMGQGNMMGHGMMHQGMGHGMGMGKGMMGGWPVPAGEKLSGDDVKGWLEHFLARTGNPNLKLGTVTEKDDYTVAAEIVTIDNSLVQRLEIDRRTGQRWQVE